MLWQYLKLQGVLFRLNWPSSYRPKRKAKLINRYYSPIIDQINDETTRRVCLDERI